jgi:hypothetical protein
MAMHIGWSMHKIISEQVEAQITFYICPKLPCSCSCFHPKTLGYGRTIGLALKAIFNSSFSGLGHLELVVLLMRGIAYVRFMNYIVILMGEDAFVVQQGFSVITAVAS